MPVPASHTLSVLSQLPLTIRLASGLIATLVTPSVCPLSVGVSDALAGIPHLHRFVPAAADDAFAIGAEGHAGDSVGVPLESEESRALPASQTFTLSSLPLTMRWPSGLNATLLTEPVCPSRERIIVPLSASQTFTRALLPAAAADDAFAIGAEGHAGRPQDVCPLRDEVSAALSAHPKP